MAGGIGERFYAQPYMASFRIDLTTTSSSDYAKRLQALETAIDILALDGVWKAPTSCFIFKSARTLDEMGGCIARAIDLRKDMVLVACVGDIRQAGLIGVAEDMATLSQLLPGLKKLA